MKTEFEWEAGDWVHTYTVDFEVFPVNGKVQVRELMIFDNQNRYIMHAPQAMIDAATVAAFEYAEENFDVDAYYREDAEAFRARPWD